MDQVREAKVSILGELVEGEGTEEDDDEWKFVGDRGEWPTPDPAADLHPKEVATQSPYTLDLVRHATVHGFTKDRLCEAELALQDSSVRRRVEAPTTPATMNT